MTIEPKILFIERLKEELEDKLTFRDLRNVTRIATEILDGFKVEKKFEEIEVLDDELIDAYTSALKVEGRSQKTIDRYVYVIGRLMKFANVGIRQITVYNLRDYLT